MKLGRTGGKLQVYFEAHGHPPTDCLKQLLSSAEALVFEQTHAPPTLPFIEECLNEVVRGIRTPLSFANLAGQFNEPGTLRLLETIHHHPSIKRVYVEKSPFSTENPWEALNKEEVSPQLGQQDQLRRLLEILRMQAQCVIDRDEKLAIQLKAIVKQHSGNIVVIRGSSHEPALRAACEKHGLTYLAYSAPYPGYELMQTQIIEFLTKNITFNLDNASKMDRGRLLFALLERKCGRHP